LVKQGSWVQTQQGLPLLGIFEENKPAFSISFQFVFDYKKYKQTYRRSDPMTRILDQFSPWKTGTRLTQMKSLSGFHFKW